MLTASLQAEPRKSAESIPPAPSKAKAEPPKRTTSQKSRKRIITSEDENENALEPPLVEPTSSARRADDDAAMEAMMGMDVDDLDVELEETQDSRVDADDPPKTIVKKEPGIRKKRKVKASETVVNEKGYTGEYIVGAYLHGSLSICSYEGRLEGRKLFRRRWT